MQLWSKRVGAGSGAWQHCLYYADGMEDTRLRRSWPLVPQVQRDAEAGECVAELMSLQEGTERPLHKAVRVKCKLQGPWDMEMPKKDAGMGWSWPQREAV